MNYLHLIAALIAVTWAVSIEWRLWLNLRILSEKLQVDKPKRSGNLHAVEK
jgi:hypothetical protein